MVVGQEIRIKLLQSHDFLFDRLQVLRGFALLIMQLFDVGGHNRAFAVKQKPTGLRIEGEGIEGAGEGLGLAHCATRGSQMFAGGLYADASNFRHLCFRQSYFKRWVSRFNDAASLTFGAMVKQHRTPPREGRYPRIEIQPRGRIIKTDYP